MKDDPQLLRQYMTERSETAFSELVNRHIDLVYSAALRVAGGDSHLAQDVTQVVFTDLARKAWGLPRDVVLAGWLHRHTCFTAAKAVRTERRRQLREQTAMEMRTLDDHPEPTWELMAPHLDEGLNQLSAADRDALVLRFLKAQDFRAVGVALGVSEDAAQKRVSRALDKLRGVLSRRGVTLTTAAMASVLATEAVTAAPAGLAITVTAASMTAAATVGTGISLTMMKVMAMTKLQMSAAGVVLVAVIATPFVLQQQSLNQARQEIRQVREENQSLQTQAGQLAALTAENERLSNLVAHAAPAPARKPDQMAELLRLRNQVTRLQTDAQTNGKPSDTMVELINNPAMKEFMKSMYASMVDKKYSKFWTDAHLTADQTAALKELLVKKQTAVLDLGMAALSKQSDLAKRREVYEQVKAAQAATDEEIKQLLGADTYAQFQAYDKSQDERAALTAFEMVLPASAALTEDQETRLAQAMKEERKQHHTTMDPAEKIKLLSDPGSFLNPERLKKLQQEEEQLNQAYLARAQDILSPDQLAAFEKHLASLQQMQAASMELTAKILGAHTNN